MRTDKRKQTDQVPLLEVRDFSLTFEESGNVLPETELEVIHKLDVTIYQGEIVAVVGASGSGKSLLANAILGVLPDNAVTNGTLNYKGEALSRKRQIALRGNEISLIPQSVNALDPLMKTAKQVQAVIKNKDKQAIQQTIFKKVGLADGTGDLYPFELSGGMSRRVLAATAMVSGANLVIADEPTPGLDPKALNDTVKHMKQLAVDGKGIMFITHDIDVALQVADTIVVIYEGETVEFAQAKDFSGKGENLRHPYTKALWNALPQNGFSSFAKSEAPVSEGKQVPINPVLTVESEASMLEIKGISYHYPGAPWLFKNMHLSIKPGEIVGVFGASGSGKSTMGKIIGGYKEPVEGKVLIDGRSISPSAVQVVWQHPEMAINPRWKMRRMLQEESNLNVEFMKAFGIKEEWLSRLPRELSGGELQRFSLARALAGDVKYLIADEITTMLDAVTQAEIWHLVLTLAKERDIGVLVISHDQQLLQSVSDRIINFADIK